MTGNGRRKAVLALKPYTQNLTKEYHLRELARKLDVHHQTLRPYLDRLKEKGILKETQQGRNKVFSLNHKSDLLPYYLIQAEADRTADFLENKNTIRAFWKNFKDKTSGEVTQKIEVLALFGSFARGAEDKESDIDLFLAAPEGASSEIITTCEKLESITGRDIEIERTSDLQNLIVHQEPTTFGEIVNNHIVLFGIEKFIQIARRFHGV